MNPTRLSAVVALAIVASLARAQETPLEAGFRDPPQATKPWVYWYWISGHLTKEGITRDLEAMQRVGIGEAFIGDIFRPESELKRGPVITLSDEWFDMIAHAAKEGRRLGVDIGLFNCGGWSQSGGPWNTPDKSMRYLVSTEQRVRGPVQFSATLAAPKPPFQDVAAIAFPAPANDGETLAARKPHVTTTPAVENAGAFVDGDVATIASLPIEKARKTTLVVDLDVADAFTARSLSLYPPEKPPMPFLCDAELQVEEKGTFRTIRVFKYDRQGTNVSVGPMVYGPVSIAFPATTAKNFRLILSKLEVKGAQREQQVGLGEIELSSAARVDSYVEKQLGKMFPAPLPFWDSYRWPAQSEPDALTTIAPERGIDLTDRVAPDGTLAWDVPAGDWVIVRTMMRPTGVTNVPAAPEAKGPEVDKMNREAVSAHFDAYVGRILSKIPAEDRVAIKHVVADSYETGSQNWTDGLREAFTARYGYDPRPWLPTLTGRVVGNADRSDRFLWDLRRLVADRVATDYVGGLRDASHQHGINLWLENYGHWGFPAEFLQYGGQSDEVGGEFWVNAGKGENGHEFENRGAASAAHIYGKPIVHAEAFTAGPTLSFTQTPASLRPLGDWAQTLGVNHFVFHVWIQQAYEKPPGVNAWFGTEINRHNTWFDVAAKPWIDSIRRGHFLLQQGRSAADVAYFIGEDAPQMAGPDEPAPPTGTLFDYVNAEVIVERMKVEAGRFVLPGGASYRLLVVPAKLDTMRPETLAKLDSLVRAGGTILVGANRPTRSPSLQDFPKADEKVRTLADGLWPTTGDERAVDKGRVLVGITIDAALARIGVGADVSGIDAASALWTHRVTDEGDVYFITNQKAEAVEIVPSFRVTDRQPEWWDAVTGERRTLPEFRAEQGRTIVPLSLAPTQSAFIVFRKTGEPSGGKNFPPMAARVTVAGPWSVAFDPKWGGPASPVAFDKLIDWSQHAEPLVRDYSGTARYSATFDYRPAAGRTFIDLGDVKGVARVRLNDTDLGVVWTYPWRCDATAALKAGSNALEVEVTTPWANRLIAEAEMPEEKQLLWTARPGAPRGKPRQPAGLLGPVTVRVAE